MIVAISVQGSDLSAQVDPRFGRAAGFLIGDPESGEFEHLSNPNVNAGGGAGIQTSQMVVERGAKVVITGNVGPNAFRVLEAAGVGIYTGASGTAEQALADFKEGKLASAGAPTVKDKAGMSSGPTASPGAGDTTPGPGPVQGGGAGMGGGGGGGGGGRGGGRGMGMGRGRGGGR